MFASIMTQYELMHSVFVITIKQQRSSEAQVADDQVAQCQTKSFYILLFIIAPTMLCYIFV